ncbi:MAG: PEP-CTERM sorting domain-containing protein [Gammaproteobacteria bacterium]|nr:PEP-CTERM sorting domain-containing protein [Gammaproteobacteria bacterium]
MISVSSAGYRHTTDAGVLIKVDNSDFIPNSFAADLAHIDCAAGTGGCTSSGTFTLRGQIRIGVPMSIDMYAFAHGQSLVGNLDNAGSAACIDPLITIDPDFADAANFTLYVSPGVGNTVPLPASALLLGSGVLALCKRRRRGGV